MAKFAKAFKPRLNNWMYDGNKEGLGPGHYDVN
jgi:hypothetical protein